MFRTGYLRLSTGPHVIYYRNQGDRLDVLRVLHNSMASDRHL